MYHLNDYKIVASAINLPSFCYNSASILSTKFVIDTLQNLFSADLVIYQKRNKIIIICTYRKIPQSHSICK